VGSAPKTKMYVGVMRLGLVIPGARSLKDKRRVVLSFKERVRGRFKVSIAEVGSLDNPRHATLGVAVVSNEAAVCDSVLAGVAGAAGTLPDAVLADRATEIVPFGASGSGVRGGIEAMLDLGPSAGHDDPDEER
jgi:uncharacterized protein YlxP (DUF503 family)